MGLYKIWLCRCGFSLSTCVSPSVPPFLSRSSNRPLVLPQGSNSSEIRGSTHPAFCLSHYSSVLCSLTISHFVPLCHLSSPLFFSPSAFCFDWTRGGGGWALRRGSRRHWARPSPRDQPRLTPDSLSSPSCTLLRSNRRWPAFLLSSASNHEFVAAVQNQLLWARTEV